MKKIVSLFLALTMALSLAACGSKTGEQAAAGSGTQKEDTLVKEISSPWRSSSGTPFPIPSTLGFWRT